MSTSTAQAEYTPGMMEAEKEKGKGPYNKYTSWLDKDIYQNYSLHPSVEWNSNAFLLTSRLGSSLSSLFVQLEVDI